MLPQELAKCWSVRFRAPPAGATGHSPCERKPTSPSRVRDTHTGSPTAPRHRRGAGRRQAHSQAEGTACCGVRALRPSAAAQTPSPHGAPGVAGSSRETGGPAPQHREDADGPRQGDQSRHGGHAPASPRAARGEGPAARTHADVKWRREVAQRPCCLEVTSPQSHSLLGLTLR